MAREKLGEILVQHGALSRAQLEEALASGHLHDGPLGHYLVSLGWITHGDVAKALAVQSGRPYVPPELLVPEPARLVEFSLDVLESLHAVPVKGEGKNTFAVAAPRDIAMLAELERLVGARVHVVVTDEDAIPKALRGRYDRRRRLVLDGDLQDRRFARRVACQHRIVCHYRFLDAEGQRLLDTSYRGQLLDISPGGGRVAGGVPDMRSRRRLVAPDVSLEAELIAVESKAQPPIRVKGHVMWVQRTDSHWAELGAAWEPVRKLDEACLRALQLRERQAEASARAGSIQRGSSRLPDVPDGVEVMVREELTEET
jgi:hypothetical protein